MLVFFCLYNRSYYEGTDIMKRLICVLFCLMLCGCGLNKHNNTLFSGDVTDDKNIIIDSIDENYSFEEIKMPDGITLKKFWLHELYTDAENSDEDNKAILYIHRGDSFEKLERIKYGGVDEFGEPTDDSFIWSTNDGEYVWFLGLVGEYNGKYVLYNEFLSSTYLIDRYGSENLLTETHETIEINYLSDCPQICGNMIVYTSYNYAVGTNSIWVHNLDTKEEYKIDFGNDDHEHLVVVGWINEDTLVLQKNSEIFIHKPNESLGCELLYTIDSEKYEFKILDTDLILSEKGGCGVMIIDLDTMNEYNFDLPYKVNVWDNYKGTLYSAISEDGKSIVILNLETNDYEIFEWDKDTYINSAYFGDDGEVFITDSLDILSSASDIVGIYRLVE